MKRRVSPGRPHGDYARYAAAVSDQSILLRKFSAFPWSIGPILALICFYQSPEILSGARNLIREVCLDMYAHYLLGYTNAEMFGAKPVRHELNLVWSLFKL